MTRTATLVDEPIRGARPLARICVEAPNGAVIAYGWATSERVAADFAARHGVTVVADDWTHDEPLGWSVLGAILENGLAAGNLDLSRSGRA